MLGFKRWLIVLLLLSGNCFANTAFVNNDYFLYYLNTGTNGNEATLYYGAITREDKNQNWVEFDKMAEVQVEGCPMGYKANLVCKINKFLEADQNNRSSMIKVLVNRPVIIPVAQMVAMDLS